MLIPRRRAPARPEAEVEGRYAASVEGREALEEGFLGVEEAPVLREQAQGLGVEGAVGFGVDLAGDEEEPEARGEGVEVVWVEVEGLGDVQDFVVDAQA